MVHIHGLGRGADATPLVAAMRDGIDQIQAEMEVVGEFPPEVERVAQAAAAHPRLPSLDRTDIEFVTIDPPTAQDLDQALHIERTDRGFTVHYAIADVAAFVAPGDAVDVEAHRRGETLYGADSKVPLHPKVISEGAASLLADQVRPALLWTMQLDESGEGVDVQVERALVRSRAKLNYAEVQRLIDTGQGGESLRLLKVVGELREAKELARGGASLPLPDQEITVDGDRWSLDFRTPLPAEGWNAQISLLTGFGAATLMLEARVGVLRTLPPAADRDLARLRRTAHALAIDWPKSMGYAEFVRALNPGVANQAAMISACTRVLRGSGYAAFNGELPAQMMHSALAAPYAHVTAPLRRLVDRYAGEICLSICTEVPVPDWVLTELESLPQLMQDSNRRANAYDRAVTDLVETGLLSGRVGSQSDGVIVTVDDKDDRRGTLMIQDPAIEAPVKSSAPLPLGDEVTARLVSADLATRKVAFEVSAAG